MTGLSSSNPFNGDDTTSVTFDIRTHRAQALGQIDDFGFLGNIFQHRGPCRETCCHHDVFCATNGGEIKNNPVTYKPVRLGYHIAMIYLNIGPQLT